MLENNTGIIIETQNWEKRTKQTEERLEREQALSSRLNLFQYLRLNNTYDLQLRRCIKGRTFQISSFYNTYLNMIPFTVIYHSLDVIWRHWKEEKTTSFTKYGDLCRPGKVASRRRSIRERLVASNRCVAAKPGLRIINILKAVAIKQVMRLGKDAHKWTCKDVGLWLTENGFDDHADLFAKQHKIDGGALLVLNEDDLRNPPLELKVLGDIKRLSLAIASLQRKHSRPTHLTLPNATNGHVKRKFVDQIDSVDGFVGQLRRRDFSDSDIDDDRPDVHPFSNISETGRTLISLVYAFSVFFVTSFVMVFVHDRVPDMKKYPPLPDIVLDNVPLIPWAFQMCEVTALILTAVLTTVLIFHKHRVIVIRRMAALCGTVFLLRCVTMFVTSLSVPGIHLECSGGTSKVRVNKL